MALQASKVKLGGQDIKKMYLCETLVWPIISPTPTPTPTAPAPTPSSTPAAPTVTPTATYYTEFLPGASTASSNSSLGPTGTLTMQIKAGANLKYWLSYTPINGTSVTQETIIVKIGTTTKLQIICDPAYRTTSPNKQFTVNIDGVSYTRLFSDAIGSATPFTLTL